MKNIKLLNGNLKFTPERLVEFYQPSGAPGASGMGALSTGDEDDEELRKKRHSGLEDKITIGQRQAAYDSRVGQLTPNKPVSADEDFFGGNKNDPTLGKDGVALGDSHFDTAHRFAKMNNSAGGYNVNQVVNRLKSKHGIDITKDQKAMDSIEFALRYQRSKSVKFDADQTLNQVVDNLAKDPEYYSKDMENLVVDQPDYKEKQSEPTPYDTDDYENVDVDDVENWWPEGQGRPNGYVGPEEMAPLKESEENWGTEFFVKPENWEELSPEAQADILKRKAEKPETTFFQRHPKLISHEKIKKSREAPTERPATPPDWDKPTEPIDEIAADGAPGGFGGTLNYTTNWQTPNYFTTNQVSKFKNSPTDGQDDENSHIIPQEPSQPLKDNGYEEYVNTPERPTFTDNLEEMWLSPSNKAVKVNNGWPVGKWSKLPDTQGRRKKIKETLYYGSQHSGEDWEKFKERVKNMSHEERQSEILRFLMAGKAMGSKHKDIRKSHEEPKSSGVEQEPKPEEPIDEYFYYYYDPKLGKKVKKQSIPGMSSPVFDAPMPPQEPGEKEKPSKGKVLPLEVPGAGTHEYEPGEPIEIPIKKINKSLSEAINNCNETYNEINSATLNADLHAQNMMEKINSLLEEKEQTDETAIVGDSLAITNRDLEEISTFPEPEKDPEKGKKVYMGKESEPYKPIAHLPSRKFDPEKGNVPIITEPPLPFPWFGKNEAKLDKPKRLPYTLYKEPTGLEKFVPPEETAADFIRKVLKGEPEEAQKLNVYVGKRIPHTFDPGKKMRIPIKKKEELANESFKRFIDVVKNSKILG